MTLDFRWDEILYTTPKATASKEKKSGFIKIKNFWSAKDTFNRVKWQGTN